MPFDEIATIVGRSPGGRTADVARQRSVVEAFFRASRNGDFQGLLAVLDPDVALRVDEAALRMSVRSGFLKSEFRGAKAVAERFAGAAQSAQLALINGVPGAVWAPRRHTALGVWVHHPERQGGRDRAGG